MISPPLLETVFGVIFFGLEVNQMVLLSVIYFHAYHRLTYNIHPDHHLVCYTFIRFTQPFRCPLTYLVS